jgi:hypothetical protein
MCARSCIFATVLVFWIQTICPAQATRTADAHQQRDSRARAEAMVRPSGPLREPARRAYLPTAWEPNRVLAGTYADPAARYRYARHTFPWWSPIGYGFYGYGWYGCGWWRGPCYGGVIACP